MQQQRQQQQKRTRRITCSHLFFFLSFFFSKYFTCLLWPHLFVHVFFGCDQTSVRLHIHTYRTYMRVGKCSANGRSMIENEMNEEEV